MNPTLRKTPRGGALLLSVFFATQALAGENGWASGTVFRLPPVNVTEQRTVIYSPEAVTRLPIRKGNSFPTYPQNWLSSAARITVSVEFIVNDRGLVEDLSVTAITLLDKIDLTNIRSSSAVRKLNGGLPLTDYALQEILITDFREAATGFWKSTKFVPAEKDGTKVYVKMAADTYFHVAGR